MPTPTPNEPWMDEAAQRSLDAAAAAQQQIDAEDEAAQERDAAWDRLPEAEKRRIRKQQVDFYNKQVLQKR